MPRILRLARRLFWPPEAWLVLRVAATAIAARLLFAALPLDRFMQRWTPKLGRSPHRAERIVDTTDWVLGIGGRHSCLLRSLVLYRLLRQCGEQVRLCFGLKRGPSGDLTGHAWLERQGQRGCVSGDEPGDYRVTFSYPPPDAKG